MSESRNEAEEAQRETPLLRQIAPLQQRENQIVLLLTLAIGALTGLAVVAFIVLTERLGMRLYPVGSAAWRRVLIPVAGSLGIGTATPMKSESLLPRIPFAGIEKGYNQ
jgi:hypothetical protein